MKIIIASKSWNRQKILRLAGIDFQVVVPNVDESQIQDKDFRKRVVKIACLKAGEVALRKKGLIVAADTFSVFQGKVLGKPKTKKQAFEMIKALSGKKSVSHTGCCIIDSRTGKKWQDVFLTAVYFRKLNYQEIKEYVNHEPVCQWAAGYAAIHSGAVAFIKKISGPMSAFTHGIPVDFVKSVIIQAGQKGGKT